MASTTYINIADNSQEICCPIHPADTNWNKTFHPSAGRKHGSVCRCSVCAVYCVCSVLCRLAPSCAVLRRLAPSCRLPSCGMVQMVSAAKQSFSRPYLPSAPKKSDRNCYFLFRPNICTSGSTSSRRKQQQQQQQEDTTAAGGGSSSSSIRNSRRKQQEAAGGSRRKQQQAAGRVRPPNTTFTS